MKKAPARARLLDAQIKGGQAWALGLGEKVECTRERDRRATASPTNPAAHQRSGHSSHRLLTLIFESNSNLLDCLAGDTDTLGEDRRRLPSPR